MTEKSLKNKKRCLYIGAGVLALVIAVLVAILAIILSKNDPSPPSPEAVVPDPPTDLQKNDNLTN